MEVISSENSIIAKITSFFSLLVTVWYCDSLKNRTVLRESLLLLFSIDWIESFTLMAYECKEMKKEIRRINFLRNKNRLPHPPASTPAPLPTLAGRGCANEG